MEKLKVALIGAGQRGAYVYSDYIHRNREKIELVAVAEINELRRKAVAELHNIQKEYIFEDWSQLLELDKFCDAVIIATSDEQHFEPIKIALAKGYHLLVEKPMSNKEDEIEELSVIAKQYEDRIFAVAHVLRYTPFFEKMKQVMDSEEIGEIISIQHNENIGYFHMAHSFVRGNWNNSLESSPLILAKSCHDMDILLYLVGSKCKKIASFGSLKHFCKSKMPKDAAKRCLDCKWNTSCPYSALKIYLKDVTAWPANTITENLTIEGVTEALQQTDYGKCVYQSDNNVVDNQVTILEFENGVSATFQLCGFTHAVSRTIKIMGSKGEIRGHMEKNKIEIYDFLTDTHRTIDTTPVASGHVGHGGGDDGLMNAFVENMNRVVREKGKPKSRTSASVSVFSHQMAFAAEKARIENIVVELKGTSSK